MLIDPDRAHAIVVEDEIRPRQNFAYFEFRRIGSTNDAVYFVDRNPSQAHRFGFPDLTKKPIGKGLPDATIYSVVVVHDDRLFCVRELLKIADENENLPPGDRTAYRDLHFDLWTMKLDGSDVCRVGANLPRVFRLVVSSHYGLVALVRDTGVGRSDSYPALRAVEVVDAPKN